MWSSEPQRFARRTLTSTSPAPGSGRSNSLSTTSPGPMSEATLPRTPREPMRRAAAAPAAYPPPVPAYLIGDVEVEDADAYAGYTARVPESIARHGGRFLVRGGAAEPLEGEWRPGRLVVIEFPDMATLKAWWGSDEYRELAALRRAASRGSLLAIEGAAG